MKQKNFICKFFNKKLFFYFLFFFHSKIKKNKPIKNMNLYKNKELTEALNLVNSLEIENNSLKQRLKVKNEDLLNNLTGILP